MADGYAQVSGKHGVVIGQNGPGISNCVTAVAAAFWAHSPVVMITPETGTMGQGLGGFQEANQLPMFQEFVKYQGHIANENRMAEITARCFDRAMSEIGPTQLNIPRDRFYGDIDVEIPAPMVLDRGAGGKASLDAAADMLAEAEFPVIVSGGGVVMGDAMAEAVALAERLGAPVVNSYLHNDSFPASHPQWCGPLGYQGSKAAMKLIAKADVVLALGTRLGPFGTLPQHDMDYWPKDAKIIQVDADHKMLGLVKPISVGIHGDAGAAAEALLERLDGRTLVCDAARHPRRHHCRGEGGLGSRTRRVDPRKDDFSMDMIAEADAEEDSWLHPRQVLRELEKAMPARAMVSTDIGNINSVANSYLRFEEPRSFFAPMSWGNCGYALPTIIGAKKAAPDRPAISYAGDGAWAMSMSELMTAVRHDIPVTSIVFHNRQWGAEKKNQVDFYGRRFVAGELEGGENYSEIAKAMGAEGVRVDELDQVGPALTAAVDAQMNEGKTTVIEIMCTKELGDPFRKGALKTPAATSTSTRTMSDLRGIVSRRPRRLFR